MTSPEPYWHATRGSPALPAGEPPRVCDVAVVGGGWLGAATAYWLARAGARVVLLESVHPAAGATGRNGGFMVAGTAEPYDQAMARVGREAARAVWELTLENRSLLREVLAREEIDCEYREPGHLALALGAAQGAALRRTVAALRADGFAAEWLDRAQTQALVGTPLGPAIDGALYAPEDGLLHPVRLVVGLLGAAARHGATVVAGAPVRRIEAGAGGVQVATDRGTTAAGAAVVAVNAWTDELVPDLAGVITPVRGQALAYAPLAPTFGPGMGAAVTPTGEYWHQTPDGSVVIGGCRATAPDYDVGVREAVPTAEVQAAIEHVLPRLFPALGGLRVARRWAGLMAFTSDYLPVADAAPGLPGVWVVGGFCGHGMPFGLVLGRLLAEAALGGARPPALHPLRLGRPTLRREAA